MSIALDNTPAGPTYEVSPRTLGLACASAFAVATVVLTLFVLPAERGIDITGLGAKLGLTQMRSGEADATPDTTPVATAAPSQTSSSSQAAIIVEPQSQQSISKATPMRSDEMTVVLKPHSGLEVKAEMKTGDHLIFHWDANGPLKMDMHGEKPNDGERFTRYWMQSDLTTAQGSFTAPFDGHHGWFWRNRGESDVTLRIRTSGFYEKLYIPK